MSSDLVQCPYDESHIIQKKRLAIHLRKCALQHPEIQLRTCKFNSRHEVRPAEYDYHILHCPDRAEVERAIQSYAVTTEHRRLRNLNESSTRSDARDGAHGHNGGDSWEDEGSSWEDGARRLDNHRESDTRDIRRDNGDWNGTAASIIEGTSLARGDRFGFVHPRVQDMRERGLLPDHHHSNRLVNGAPSECFVSSPNSSRRLGRGRARLEDAASVGRCVGAWNVTQSPGGANDAFRSGPDRDENYHRIGASNFNPYLDGTFQSSSQGPLRPSENGRWTEGSAFGFKGSEGRIRLTDYQMKLRDAALAALYNNNNYV